MFLTGDNIGMRGGRGSNPRGWPTMDRAYTTHDGRTVDSAGAFMENELERLDPKLHLPLAAVTWGRDIDLREDVTIADEASSYTNTSYAAPGGVVPTGIGWAGKSVTAIPGIEVDIMKTAQPLNLWAMELKYSIPELESAIKVGRPIDQQKFEGLNLKHQMDIDQVVYTGDSTINFTGVFNNSAVTVSTAAAVGTGNGTAWSTKTPTQILADVNTLLTNTWAASGYAVIPDRILIPPAQYGLLLSQTVSTAGNVSILKFLEENNLAAQRGGSLTILPVKWAIGMGVGGTPQVLGTVDRAFAYSKDPERIRYPMTPLQRTPIQYQGIYHVTTYYCRLGMLETVYQNTMAYLDGI
jgi:hypothetical protein